MIFTARLICPFFFFLISHLCHTFSILWQTFTRFYFTLTFTPICIISRSLFRSTVVHQPQLHFNFIFGLFSLHLINFLGFLLFSFFFHCRYRLNRYLTLIVLIFIICFLLIVLFVFISL